jgi:peptidoglycan hydrolase CwlO-like protein
METIISLAVAVCALIFTALSFRRTSNQDTSETASQRATMSADIRYIRSSIDDIKLDNKAIQNDVTELKTKVVEIEQSSKSAHKRLDDLIRKENSHE